jgi:hypothetical protein
MNARPALLCIVLLSACGPTKSPVEPTPAATRASRHVVPGETHFGSLTQLTSTGENAEAYWSFSGRELSLQSRSGEGEDCDRIYRMSLVDVLDAKHPPDTAITPLSPVSSGKGTTTCSYFTPGDKQLIYASTHLGGDACPPRPDHSQGYVWALYDSYDIFKTNPSGGDPLRLTDTAGYDAEATVCGKDGSIVFTSTRDGEIDLYRMDQDGKNTVRLTDAPGYDGGAFFNADCSKIVWRASRPRPGPELDDYRRLLAQHLVRPSKLELWTANADGSEAQQITYLDAASFAPFWHPSQKRILFSSNYGDPKGREFDLWAVNSDGSALERITYTPGFDGFPMFSPDGRWLAFASNRATLEGRRDTNVFLARWLEPRGESRAGPADRIRADVDWLADEARQGRGIGQPGLEAAGAYIESTFKALGLVPEGVLGNYRQPFPVITQVKLEDETSIAIDGNPLAKSDYAVLGYSPPTSDLEAQVVLAGYGIVARELGVDDYKGIDIRNKIALVRRFVPEGGKFANTQDQRRYGDIRQKAFAAREKGAKALIVVDDPLAPKPARADWATPPEAPLPSLMPEGYADAGLPVIVIKRALGRALIEHLQKPQKPRVTARLHIRLTPIASDAFNVAGRIVAEPNDGHKLPGTIVIGAHYDHLGMGGRYSLSPAQAVPHLGADDNASGTAVLLELARALNAQKQALRRDVLLIAFSGEESGLLGSAYYVADAQKQSKGKLDVVAMINMDMVGRMRNNQLHVLGAETANEWKELVKAACAHARVDCAISGDGYGPSDQMSFYTAGVPVLHLFTGTHGDYHKPSDTPDKVNVAAASQVAAISTELALALSVRPGQLKYNAAAKGPGPRGDQRSFNASLGTIPDYGGPGPGKKGVLLAGVRPGGAAEKAGIRQGDTLIQLGKSEIGSVEDFMFVLNASRPGETVPAVVLRGGKPVKLEVTFQESQRRGN